MATMFALVLVGVLATHRVDKSKGSDVAADLAMTPAAIGEGSTDQLEADSTRQLATEALAGLGAGPLTGDGAEGPSEMVLAKEPSESAPDGPTAVLSDPGASATGSAAVATSSTAPPTTVPTTVTPTTKRPTTTRPPTTKPPTTAADPTEASTNPGDPATTADPAAPDVSHPAGWVDAGNGVWLPKVMVAIRHCESHDNYKAVNSSSGASGAYQFISGSWASYGFAAKYGVSKASSATPAQQDEAALATWERSGTSPWNSSRSCWG